MTADPRDLLPAVLSLKAVLGRLDLSRGLGLDPGPGCEAPAELLRTWLGKDLPATLGQAQVSSEGGVPVLRLGLEAGLGLASPPGAPEEARREAYRLDIGPGGASLVAGRVEGLFRGAACLRQLVLSAVSGPGEGLPAIAACRIEDSPRFPWRGFMLDTARNFFEPAFIERLLDLAALHRLNVFHWHLTDDQAWRLDLPGLPELARLGGRRLDRRYNVERWRTGSYSAADVGRIVAYAGARGITVVPEIETPGHVVALLASHPELSCAAAQAGPGAPAKFSPEDRYGIFEDILCAGNDEVFALLDKVFEGLCGLFPGPWVHVGGDEAPKSRWRECPRCAKRLEALGLGPDEAGLESLQAWFMGRVGGLLAARGKRILGWDEILDAGAEGTGKAAIPADALVMSWRGYEGGAVGARRGHGVVMCPQTKACYLDHKQADRPGEAGQLGVCTLRDSWSFEPIPPGLGPEEEGRILGGQGNLWSELMYSESVVEYMAFPRLCALAEALWRPRVRGDYPAFLARLEVHKARLDRLDVNYRK